MTAKWTDLVPVVVNRGRTIFKHGSTVAIAAFNRRRTRALLGYGLLGVPITFLLLKTLQWLAPGNIRLPEAVSKGLENRLDDPSFWTICGAALACYIVYRVSTEPRCKRHQQYN